MDLVESETVLQPQFKLEMANFRFTFSADEEAQLPLYLGSTLRGAMGRVFRNNACMTKARVCFGCMYASQCAYAYIFETSKEQVHENNKNNVPLNIPHPFVLEPPLEAKTMYKKGEVLQFNVVLIGRGIQFLPFFISAFSQAGLEGLGAGRYHFHLSKVEQLNGEKKIPLWEGGNQFLTQPYAQILTDEQDGKAVNGITLDLQTPLRLIEGGRLSVDISFNLLMRGIFRRLYILGLIHGQGALKIPFQDYLARASEVKLRKPLTQINWQEWERYSNRQKRTLKMGGLCGRLSYQGDLSLFMPYILMAQELHIGKGTVFGLGKIVLIDIIYDDNYNIS
jgi:hypothetical protein